MGVFRESVNRKKNVDGCITSTSKATIRAERFDNCFFLCVHIYKITRSKC